MMNLEYAKKIQDKPVKIFQYMTIWKTDKWLLDVVDIFFSLQSAIFTRFT